MEEKDMDLMQLNYGDKEALENSGISAVFVNTGVCTSRSWTPCLYTCRHAYIPHACTV